MIVFFCSILLLCARMSHSPIQLSVAIITYNEERNIERCLRSVQAIADEIVVVDSFSTDRTKEICLAQGVRFIEHPFAGHVEQKNYALGQINHDYVLSLDADEALSEALQQRIAEIKMDCRFAAYRFNRLTNYCGQWIRHCGWYPDTKTRLWKRSAGRWGGENPHDFIQLDKHASVEWIPGDMLHYSFYSIADHATTANKFSEIAAQVAIEKGKKANLFVAVILNPLFTFVKKYVFQQGFRDGYYGFVICVLSAYANFLKYSKIYANQG